MNNFSHRSLLIAVSFSALLALGGCATPSNGEVPVVWDKVPTEVQKTVTDNAGGKTIDKVEKETKDGVVVYEAKIMKKDGSRTIIKVDDSGKLVGIVKKSAEKPVSWKKVPKAVRKTLSANAGGKTLDNVTKEIDDGATVYEAHVNKDDGSVVVVKVAKNGTLISTNTKKDMK